jgi:hypothetical protein
MPTDREKYGHVTMSNDQLEARIAADLYELADRFKRTEAKMIGSLLWKLMNQVREAYRTGRLGLEGR